MAQFLKEFNACIIKYGADNIAALLVEPIQSTYGDNYYPPEFFTEVRQLCDKHGICLIFDEIQTGFGATGAMWYFEHAGIQPDIVAFGKKAQTSGVMVKSNFGTTFKTPIRLEVTWDGNLCDMVRSKYILRAYEQYKILDNVRARGRQIVEGLSTIPSLLRVRGLGNLVAFDFDSEARCNDFFKKCVAKRFMCNKTRDISVRLRPNLNVSAEEVERAIAIIKDAAK